VCGTVKENRTDREAYGQHRPNRDDDVNDPLYRGGTVLIGGVMARVFGALHLRSITSASTRMSASSGGHIFFSHGAEGFQELF
jgi:hypothetical protein